jgi:3-oxoacyl-[acyl-carrier-protein] synthase-3
MLRSTVLPAAGSQLLGFGAAQPDTVVSGTELGAAFGREAAWIETRTGIQSLRRVPVTEDVGPLAECAAASALAAARIEADQIDLVVTTTCSAGSGPWDARPLARAVAPGAGWVEINAACSGFSYSLSAADTFIRTGAARHVLVVAAEQMSRLIDPADLGTSIIFGDGAGAAVVGPSPAGATGVGPVVWGSDGAQASLIECDASADGVLRMAGQQVFRWAVECMPDVALEACSRAGVAISDIEVFVPHQANLRIIDAIARKLGLDGVVIANDVTGSGNTSAASIPIALSRLVEQGAVQSGQLALLLGFGAGLSYAGQVVILP